MSGASYAFLRRMKNKGMYLVLCWQYNRKCINTWGSGPQVFPSNSGMTITVSEWYSSAQWILYSLKLIFNLHIHVEYHKTLRDYRSLDLSIFNWCLWFKKGVGMGGEIKLSLLASWEAGRISSNSSVLEMLFKILVSPCFQVRKKDTSTEEITALQKSVNCRNK